MQFIQKVASYYDAYVNADEKEGLLKTASADGVSQGDLIAFHNLTHGNMFTGKNLIKLAEEDIKESKIVAIGTAIDKMLNKEIDEETLYKQASELGFDEEDIQFILDNIERQALEAENLDKTAEEIVDVEKIAEAVEYLASNGIDPIDGLYIAAHVEGDGIADEKVAEEVAESGFTEEDIAHIAKVAEYLGTINDEVLKVAQEIWDKQAR